MSGITVGRVDDPAEVAADRMADEVIERMSVHAAGGGSPAGEGSSVRLSPGGRIRRSAAPSELSPAAGPAGGPLDAATESKIRSSGSGRPLDNVLRSQLEPAFGADLGDVRIHADSKVAPTIGATAFTFGNDIHFAPSAYDPGSADGQHVLAHELSHVVQQGGVARRTPTIRRLGAALNLIDIGKDYDTEQVDTGHYDVAIAGLADMIRRTSTCKDMLGAANPDNPVVVGNAKDWLLKTPVQTTALIAHAGTRNTLANNAKRLHAKILPMGQPEALAEITRMYNLNLTVARRSDIVVTDDGTLDTAALAARRVEYDDPNAQAASDVTIAGGKLKRSATHAVPNADVDTAGSVSFHSGNGWEVFVVGGGGDLHMASHKIGKFHHSSLLAGGAVSFAGELKVAGGKVAVMSNKSGHYRPTVDHFLHYLKTIRAQGLPLDFQVVRMGEVPDVKTAAQLVDEVDVAEDTNAPQVMSVTKDQAGSDVRTPLRQPERADVEVAWNSYKAAGHDPMKYLIDPPPAGLGWRMRPGGFEKEIGAAIAGPAVWESVSHDDVRLAMEAKWGPPQKVVRKRHDDADTSKDTFRWA